jgi:hypothetical protein
MACVARELEAALTFPPSEQTQAKLLETAKRPARYEAADNCHGKRYS